MKKAVAENRCPFCRGVINGDVVCGCRRPRPHPGDHKERRLVDDLARCGRIMSVWDTLFRKFPDCSRWSWQIHRARREGVIRATLHNNAKYAPLRDPEGPMCDEEWALLAEVALLAIN